ncbi:glycosyltransferase [Mesorhizobium sp. M0701]|uniref:glycosyltransferase n=1 Tax=Mesorhizobium sp. M0701 TaxID=2956989 RepID=UPI00333D2088
MRISHTVSSIEAQASGPSYSVPRLCQALAELGHAVDLSSLGEPRPLNVGSYRDIRSKRDLTQLETLRRLGVSAGMRRTLAASGAEIFHTHGLWMMPNVYPAMVAREHQRPLVLSPRGMLGKDALRFSKLKKRVFWALAQSTAVRYVNCFHATSDHEYEDIRAFGLRQPVAVIPNGIDLPVAQHRLTSVEAPFVLSLGRIHPKKALDSLVRAWALVAPDFPQWRLKIVGPSEVGYADQLKRLAQQLKVDSAEISGPVFGDEKIALLAEAELFALSTLHENFGMAVAESLAVCTPVISTKGAPWSGLESHGCGWWVDHGVEPFAVALRQAMSISPEQRHAMGERGRAWMERDFAWATIAPQMAEVYHWLVEGSDIPPCVRVG